MNEDLLIVFVVVGISMLFIGIMVEPFPLIKYGSGSASTYGYMTTYEEGIFYDQVWIRADYQSSNSNAYCVKKGSGLKNIIKNHIKNKDRVELNYDRYFFGSCSEMSTTINKIEDVSKGE